MQRIYSGNAKDDGKDTRGWLMGSFLEPDSLRHSDSVEVKWGTHSAGENREEWAPGTHERSLAILISGNFLIIFRDREVELSKPSDYVIYTKGIEHRWLAQEDSIILTIRWHTQER
jgi:quercetin dioxygenase-like cupin family protein